MLPQYLQLVATISFIFLGTAALFAWLQYRPILEETNTRSSNKNLVMNLKLISFDMEKVF